MPSFCRFFSELWLCTCQPPFGLSSVPRGSYLTCQRGEGSCVSGPLHRLAIGFTHYLSLLLVGTAVSISVRFSWGLLTLTLGYLDDRYDLASGLKLLWQTVIALVTAGLGVRIYFLTNPFGNMVTLGWIGYPLTVLWLLATMNMINLIDGLDGLAVGISLIASVSLILSVLLQADTCVLSAVDRRSRRDPTYNFYPARIFIGNSGTYFRLHNWRISVLERWTSWPSGFALVAGFRYALGDLAPGRKTLGRRGRGHIHYLLVHSERNAKLCSSSMESACWGQLIFLSRVEPSTIILLLGLGGLSPFTVWVCQTAVKQRTATAGGATNEGKELSHE